MSLHEAAVQFESRSIQSETGNCSAAKQPWSIEFLWKELSNQEEKIAHLSGLVYQLTEIIIWNNNSINEPCLELDRLAPRNIFEECSLKVWLHTDSIVKVSRNIKNIIDML